MPDLAKSNSTVFSQAPDGFSQLLHQLAEDRTHLKVTVLGVCGNNGADRHTCGISHSPNISSTAGQQCSD